MNNGIGKAYLNKKGQWELIMFYVDMGMLGHAPSVTTTDDKGNLFKSKEDAEKYFKYTKEWNV